MDSAVETDGAAPDQNLAEFEALAIDTPVVVDIELQQQQQVKRVVASDGTEMVVLTAARYDEIVKRPQVADWLYDQLHDERRQRLDISEKYRSCSEALAVENNLVMRYRRLLINNRLQPESVEDVKDVTNVGAELPETFFEAGRTGGEDFELRARCAATSRTGYSTESIQALGEAVSSTSELKQKMWSGESRQSVLESDEAVAVTRPVFSDDGPSSSHHHLKNSAEAAKVVTAAAEESRGLNEQSQQQQLLDEANDALKTVPMTTTSAMSRDLLQKVLEQNARLKLILKKIVEAQGLSVREFLVSEIIQKLELSLQYIRAIDVGLGCFCCNRF